MITEQIVYKSPKGSFGYLQIKNMFYNMIIFPSIFLSVKVKSIFFRDFDGVCRVNNLN